MPKSLSYHYPPANTYFTAFSLIPIQIAAARDNEFIVTGAVR